MKPSIIESLDVLTYCIRIQFFHSSEHVMRVILICFLLHKGERNIVDDVSLSYILRVRTYYFPSSSLVDCDIRHSPTLVRYWILKVPTHKTALATIFESIFQFFFLLLTLLCQRTNIKRKRNKPRCQWSPSLRCYLSFQILKILHPATKVCHPSRLVVHHVNQKEVLGGCPASRPSQALHHQALLHHRSVPAVLIL